ncbi:hypothetical protein BOTNAR_0080g00060 [Botryotinia narcissicola]|uniref:Uncharacterized protein n=1 Tax=Botryotinia narcissicola TaxID=278944 RepID=A0A4Z1J7S2_9HELO|nr:hypothetical protein BOTNAR_0080g00060 [Botryotinia narcissicola]
MFESDARSGIKDFGDTQQIPFKSRLNYSLHLKIRVFDAYDPPAPKADMAPAQSHTVVSTAVDTTSIQFPRSILQYSELET